MGAGVLDVEPSYLSGPPAAPPGDDGSRQGPTSRPPRPPWRRARPDRAGRQRWLLVLALAIALVGDVVAAVVHGAVTTTTASGFGGYGPQQVGGPGGQVFLPEQFGAVADNQHDDAAAVQKAINAAAGHGTVVLAAGRTYLCKEALRIPSHTAIRGLGPGATLHFTWFDQSRTTGGPYLSNTDPKKGNSDITLQNFGILGGGSGEPSGASVNYPNGLGSSVRMYLVHQIVVTNLLITNSPGDAMNLWAVSDATIVDNSVQRSGRGGIIVHYTNAGSNEQIRILHNQIQKLGDDAIAVAGTGKKTENTTGSLPTSIDILDNSIESWPSDPNNKIQGRGIALLGVTDTLVQGNTLVDLPQSAILLRGADLPGQVNPKTGQPWVSSNVVITGNVIQGVGQNSVNSVARSRPLFRDWGIEIDSGEAVTVSHNVLSQVMGTPISVQACSGCSNSSNTVK